MFICTRNKHNLIFESNKPNLNELFFIFLITMSVIFIGKIFLESVANFTPTNSHKLTATWRTPSLYQVTRATNVLSP